MTDTPLLDVLKALLVKRYGPDVVWTGEHLNADWKPGFQLVSYQRDFDVLWKLIEDFERGGHLTDGSPEDSGTDVVIVWDGVPKSAQALIGVDAAVHNWLTPYDWCVALSQLAFNTRWSLRFFVVDLGLGPLDSFAEHLMGQNPGLLPWLRIYKPPSTGNVLIAQASRVLGNATSSMMPTDLGLDELLADLGITQNDRTTLSRLTKEMADEHAVTFRSIWVNELTKAERRHSVSNMVAPLLLATELELAGLGSAEDLVPVAARGAVGKFCQLLSALKLLPGHHFAKRDGSTTPALLNSPLAEDFVRIDVFGIFKDLKFLLVDDKATHGYKSIIDCLLRHAADSVGAGFGSDQLGYETTPDVLAAWLKHYPDWRSPGQLPIIGKDQSGLPRFDILFLDLRLFDLETDDGRRKQAEFLKQLLACHRSRAVHSQAQDNERPLREQEKIVEEIAKSAGEFVENHARARYLATDFLLLLPALLSVVDPSLPIVLFSSSNQRRVIEQLKAFPNIITSFSKPIVSGYEEPSISPFENISLLREAIVKALILHEKRTVWKRIAHLADRCPPPIVSVRSESNRDIPNGTKGFLGDKKKLFYNLAEISGLDQLSDLDRYPRAMPPSREKLTEGLRSSYLGYILSENWHDFGSVTYEFIESVFSPDEAMVSEAEDPFWIDASTGVPASIEISSLPDFIEIGGRREYLIKSQDGRLTSPSPRNALARALGLIRNRKAHGWGIGSAGRSAKTSMPGPVAMENPHWVRAIALLQSFFLLDFIDGRLADDRTRFDWSGLCRFASGTFLQGILQQQYFAPRILTTSAQVGWCQFCLLALIWGQSEARGYASRSTNSALLSLGKAIWNMPDGIAGVLRTESPASERIGSVKKGTMEFGSTKRDQKQKGRLLLDGGRTTDIYAKQFGEDFVPKKDRRVLVWEQLDGAITHAVDLGPAYVLDLPELSMDCRISEFKVHPELDYGWASLIGSTNQKILIEGRHLSGELQSVPRASLTGRLAIVNFIEKLPHGRGQPRRFYISAIRLPLDTENAVDATPAAGGPPQAAAPEMAQMAARPGFEIGIAKSFDPDSEYGVIVPSGRGKKDKILVHIDILEQSGYSTLSEGQVVEYKVRVNPRNGQRSAINLRILD